MAIFCLAILATPSKTSAQALGIINANSLTDSSEFIIQNWTTENGLPQNSINQVIQSSDGFLWLATFYGLARFDGLNFKLFTAWNTAKLNSNSILNIFESRDSTLWFTTQDQKIYLMRNGVITKMHSSTNGVAAFAQGSGDTVIVADFKGDIDYVIGEEVKHACDIPSYHSMVMHRKNELYFSSREGLYKLYQKRPIKVDSLNIHSATNLFSDGDTLWLMTDKGLGAIINNKFWPHPLAKLTLKKKVNSIGKFNNELWLGTADEGIIRIVGNKIRMLTKAHGLSSNTIRSFFKGTEDNIWVGTGDAGLNKLQKRLFKSFGTASGLGAMVTNPIYQQKNGNILIGTSCGGVTKYANNQLTRIYQDTLRNNCVWSILEDKHENIWIGSYYGGITKINKDKTVNYFSIDEGLPGSIVYSLYEDKQGTIWIGTDKGLCSYKNGEIHFLETTNGIKITYLLEDHDGDLWFGSDEGLGVLKGKAYEIYTTADGLSNNHVRCIYEDHAGVFWIGTYGGSLNRMKGNKITTFPIAPGALNQNVSGIAEDEFGYFWLTSNHGIYAISKEDLNNYAAGKSKRILSQHFDRNYGFLASEFNGGFQQSILKDDKGHIWFPSINGAITLSPSEYHPSEITTSIVIDELKTDDSSHTTFGAPILIPYGNTRIEIEYTIPKFNAPLDIRFEYRFKSNKGSPSVPVDNRRSISFHELPPGEYQMQLRVINSDLSVTEISFIIETPFWQSSWFVIGNLLLFMLIVIAFANARIAKNRKRDRERSEIEGRVSKLELTALRAQMNPHFVFNCLNSIQHFISINDELGANKYLGKFSSLMRMTLEHSSEHNIPLHKEIELLGLYIELEKLRFDKGFDFEIFIDPEVDPFYHEIPGMLIQPFIENAILHGFNELGRKGLLKLSFILREHTLECIVEDDGIGRKKAKVKKKRSQAHESKGLEITSDRIKGINELNRTNINIKFIDKDELYGHGTGTTVILSFPIDNTEV